MSANKIQKNFMPLLTILLEEHQKILYQRETVMNNSLRIFAEHVMAKIKKIWDALENHPIYKPEHWDIDQLKEFQLLSENEV